VDPAEVDPVTIIVVTGVDADGGRSEVLSEGRWAIG